MNRKYESIGKQNPRPLILSIHGKFLGIGKSDLGRFEYDAKMIHYQFLDCFKLGAMLLFFIPGEVIVVAWASANGCQFTLDFNLVFR